MSYKRLHILYTVLLLLLMCVGFCVQSRYEMHEQGQCVSRYFVTASCSDTFVIIIVMIKVMITNKMTLITPLLLLRSCGSGRLISVNKPQFLYYFLFYLFIGGGGQQ